jgi:hypothetical protein
VYKGIAGNGVLTEKITPVRTFLPHDIPPLDVMEIFSDYLVQWASVCANRWQHDAMSIAHFYEFTKP